MLNRTERGLGRRSSPFLNLGPEVGANHRHELHVTHALSTSVRPGWETRRMHTRFGMIRRSMSVAAKTSITQPSKGDHRRRSAAIGHEADGGDRGLQARDVHRHYPSPRRSRAASIAP
jgi:hypothetical protein